MQTLALSRPTRARGLKQVQRRAPSKHARVAPYAGAWIETKHFALVKKYYESRPTRARGLKHDRDARIAEGVVSRPTRARGLKLLGETLIGVLDLVAPHAGTWIETCLSTRPQDRCSVAPHAGAWICRWRHGWRVISKDGLMGTQWTFSICNNWGNDCLAVTE